MAPSTTIIPIPPHAEGAQAALRSWLGLVAAPLQAHARIPGDATSAQLRARILRQAASTMLAPVAPRPHAVRGLLR